MRTGKLDLALNLDGLKTYTLYPLCTDGTRRAEIPLKFSNGKVEIQFDTAQLPNGPTFIFELATR